MRLAAAALALAVGLAGCNADAVGRPDVRAETPAPFDAALQRFVVDLRAARQHRMTYVQAANRMRASAHAAPGATFSDADEVLMAYVVALAAEVDAHRMTPETMSFKMQERVAQNNAEAQRARSAATLDALRMMQTVQQMQQPIEAPPPTPAYIVPPVAPPTVRLQTNCTSTQLGSFTNTNCY